MNSPNQNVEMEDLAQQVHNMDLNEAIATIQEDNQTFKLLDSILYDRISYKRSIGDGLGVLEYTDEKAKQEFEQFFKEMWGIENLGKQNGICA